MRNIKNFDKYALLGCFVVEFAKRGILKMHYHTIYDCVHEFNRLLVKDNLRLNLFITHYDIERFADKNFTCLNISEGTNILEISNEKLASIIFTSKYKGDKKFYENYITDAIENVCGKTNVTSI